MVTNKHTRHCAYCERAIPDTKRRRGTIVYCDRLCSRRARIETDPKRFIFQNTRKDPKTKCWNWVGAIDDYGYGRVGTYWGTSSSHRLSFLTYKGFLPPTGYEVHHSCENRRCANPVHLRLFTVKENRTLHSKTPPERTETAKKYADTYYQSHKDELREKRRAWRKANPDKVRGQKLRYREKHPDKYKEDYQRANRRKSKNRIVE